MSRATPRPAVRIVPYALMRPRRLSAPSRAGAGETDGALALKSGRASPGRVEAPRPLRLVRPDENAETELRARAEATARLVVEVIAGTRPPHHLAQVAVPAVCRGLERRHRIRGRVVPPRVLSCRVQRPAADVAEAAAVVVVAGRVQALALRLQTDHGRWRCTAVETTAA